MEGNSNLAQSVRSMNIDDRRPTTNDESTTVRPTSGPMHRLHTLQDFKWP